MLPTILAGLLVLASTAPHENPDEFDDFIRPYVASNNFSGNVLIERHGKVVFQRSYGYAQRDHKQLNNGSTRFHIASMSMQYTSAAILSLIEHKKLTMETTVEYLLPRTPGADKITVRDLLLQQSGIDDINSHSDYDATLQRHQTPASLVAQVDGHPLLFAPGTKHTREEHSAFNVLALLLEKQTGLPFPRAIEKILFKPLRLNATDADDDGPASRFAAHGYQPKDVADLEPADSIHWSAKAGSASILTTSADELRLIHALFSGDFLDPQMRGQLLDINPRVGFGWFRSESKEFKTSAYYMNGRAPGFASYALFIPKDDLIVIVFSNIYASASSDIGDGLARIALGLPHEAFHPLANAPAPLTQSMRFRFPADFYQPNAELTIFPRDGGTFLRWPSGDTSPLIPTGIDKFLDRSYWVPVELGRKTSPPSLLYDHFKGEQIE